MRILVIEDVAPVRDQRHHDLSQRGCKVNLAADGEDGLFLGTEYTLDAAIIDLGLPKIPGREVLRRLRDIGRNSRFSSSPPAPHGRSKSLLSAQTRTTTLDPHDDLKPIETIRGRGYLFAAPRKS